MNRLILHRKSVSKRRTNADKRKAVETLLNDKEWSQWSDNEIARKCEVHQTTVSKYRKELELTYGKHKSTRKGADGRTINTSNIGDKDSTVIYLSFNE